MSGPYVSVAALPVSRRVLPDSTRDYVTSLWEGLLLTKRAGRCQRALHVLVTAPDVENRGNLEARGRDALVHPKLSKRQERMRQRPQPTGHGGREIMKKSASSRHDHRGACWARAPAQTEGSSGNWTRETGSKATVPDKEVLNETGQSNAK